MNPVLLCANDVPNFLKIFDLVDVPQLLFYTYIPTIIISAILGFYVYKNSKTLEGKLLAIVTSLFTLWVLDILIVWIAAYNNVLMFAWQITPVFEVPLFIFIIYFIYVVTDKEKKDINSKLKIFFSALATLVFLIIPTNLNIPYYNISNCEGVPGVFWSFEYVFELITIAWVLNICLKRYRALPKTDVFRKEILYFGLGTTIFLILFVGSNIIGQLTDIQTVSFLDSLGMVVFLAVLSYLIVRYNEFKIKVFATQALVVAITLLIGSQIFTSGSITNLSVAIVTLVAFLISGFFLIRSVRREIEQRAQLEVANAGQENLIHIMNHQIKGYLGTARSIFAELSQGNDYGEMPEASKPLLSKGLDEMAAGVDYVQGILRSDSAQSGAMPYTFAAIDLKNIVSDLVSKQKEIAEKAGLSFESKIDDGDYTMQGDATMLEEAFKNLITNAIKYNNPNGNVTVALSRSNGKFLFSVKDTGLGISADDAKRFFTPGGVGKNSIHYNVEASGFGLSFVKPVVEKHNGKVWYISNAPEKGSTFFIELPVS